MTKYSNVSQTDQMHGVDGGTLPQDRKHRTEGSLGRKDARLSFRHLEFLKNIVKCLEVQVFKDRPGCATYYLCLLDKRPIIFSTPSSVKCSKRGHYSQGDNGD